MNKHTPTPWRRYAANKVLAGDATFIADTAFRDHDEPAVVSVEVSNANAAFIVRACNAHDYLVTALENIFTRATCAPNDDSEKADAEFMKIMEYAKAALAKARGAA